MNPYDYPSSFSLAILLLLQPVVVYLSGGCNDAFPLEILSLTANAARLRRFGRRVCLDIAAKEMREATDSLLKSRNTDLLQQNTICNGVRCTNIGERVEFSKPLRLHSPSLSQPTWDGGESLPKEHKISGMGICLRVGANGGLLVAVPEAQVQTVQAKRKS